MGVRKRGRRKDERRRIDFSRETLIVMLLLNLKCGGFN
jgi:hypothetical protein